MKQAAFRAAALSVALAGNLCAIGYSQSADRRQAADAQEKVIVFVCEHGAAKSIVAAAYFNKLARQRNLKYRAIARGTAPQEDISVSAARGLQADGLAATEQKPVRLTRDDISGAVRVVAFCSLPDDYKSVAVEEWNDVPTVSDDYGKARNAIVERVERLLNELESRK
jgi:protein-tyrosine-phosphatase